MIPFTAVYPIPPVSNTVVLSAVLRAAVLGGSTVLQCCKSKCLSRWDGKDSKGAWRISEWYMIMV